MLDTEDSDGKVFSYTNVVHAFSGSLVRIKSNDTFSGRLPGDLLLSIFGLR